MYFLCVGRVAMEITAQAWLSTDEKTCSGRIQNHMKGIGPNAQRHNLKPHKRASH